MSDNRCGDCVTPRALARHEIFSYRFVTHTLTVFFFPDLWAGANAQSFGIQGVVGVGVGMGWRGGRVSVSRHGMGRHRVPASLDFLRLFFYFFQPARQESCYNARCDAWRPWRSCSVRRVKSHQANGPPRPRLRLYSITSRFNRRSAHSVDAAEEESNAHVPVAQVVVAACTIAYSCDTPPTLSAHQRSAVEAPVPRVVLLHTVVS